MRAARHDDDGGFTLIELLVVVIIIGILAAVAIPVFLNQREKARNGAANSDARNLTTSMEAYYAEWDRYTAHVPSITAEQQGLTVGVRHAVCAYDSDDKYVVAAWHPDGTNLYIFDSARGALAKRDLTDTADVTVGAEWDTYMTASPDPLATPPCDTFDPSWIFVSA